MSLLTVYYLFNEDTTWPRCDMSNVLFNIKLLKMFIERLLFHAVFRQERWTIMKAFPTEVMYVPQTVYVYDATFGDIWNWNIILSRVRFWIKSHFPAPPLTKILPCFFFQMRSLTLLLKFHVWSEYDGISLCENEGW